MFYNKSRDTANLVCSKAAIGHKRHRLQPQLGHVPFTLHMDVRRLPAVRAKENETNIYFSTTLVRKLAILSDLKADDEDGGGLPPTACSVSQACTENTTLCRVRVHCK